MSESPDTVAQDFVEIDDELPAALPEDVPEADAIEQARDVRGQPDGGFRIPRSDSTIDEANEADRQEQAEVVSYDEDEETR
jgi:hypothetical protein